MAESIMRSSRVCIKTNKMANDEHICRVLDLQLHSDLDNYQLDIKRAAARTMKFYNTRYTNTTPYAVVAVLEVLERYHNGQTIENIYSDFTNKHISMKNFLNKHLPGESGYDTQVALYLQGMKYYKSKYRQDLNFENPKNIIEKMIEEYKIIIKGKQELAQKMLDKRNMKELRRLQDAEKFKIYHDFPKVFTYDEINHLNLTRPKNDQLELLQSGLLKHHCCYPKCPNYLENLATDKDKKKGTRRGLYYHIRYNISTLHNYVPSFHLLGKTIMKNKKIEYDTFKDILLNRIHKDDRLKSWFDHIENKEHRIQQLYNSYNIV